MDAAPPPGPERSEPPAVELRGVSRTYRERGGGRRLALNDVSLTAPRGQYLCLLGPNGSGKSTLLRLLAGTDAPGAGRVLIFGRGFGESRAAIASRLGVVFQSPGLDPLLTIRENLAMQAALFGITGPEAAMRIDRWLARLGLGARESDRVRTLSGGLVRRADLARALLHDPDLLLLDEPTTGLDYDARGQFLGAITGAHEAAHRTIVLSTHLMTEAECADRVVMLSEGRIVADGSPAALRRACGGRVIRCPAPIGDPSRGVVAGILSDRGLEVNLSDRRTLTAPAEEADARLLGAAAELARRGLPFEIGPPTLGDAYLAATGRPLEPQGLSEEVATAGTSP